MHSNHEPTQPGTPLNFLRNLITSFVRLKLIRKPLSGSKPPHIYMETKEICIWSKGPDVKPDKRHALDQSSLWYIYCIKLRVFFFCEDLRKFHIFVRNLLNSAKIWYFRRFSPLKSALKAIRPPPPLARPFTFSPTWMPEQISPNFLTFSFCLFSTRGWRNDFILKSWQLSQVYSGKPHIK